MTTDSLEIYLGWLLCRTAKFMVTDSIFCQV